MNDWIGPFLMPAPPHWLPPLPPHSFLPCSFLP